MPPGSFVEHWDHVTDEESSASQTYVEERCEMLGDEEPLDAGPEAAPYGSEQHASTAGGGQGSRDVWEWGRFDREAQNKRKSFEGANPQLLFRRGHLANPPQLIASELDCIEIHANA